LFERGRGYERGLRPLSLAHFQSYFYPNACLREAKWNRNPFLVSLKKGYLGWRKIIG
jgi:hypothetical protein